MGEPLDKYLLAGLDDRERGFSRPVGFEQTSHLYRAILQYESTRVVTEPQATQDGATVKVFYEPRLAHDSLAWLAEHGLTEDDVADLELSPAEVEAILQREVQQDQVVLEEVEAVPRHPGRRLEIDEAELLGNLDVVQRLEAELADRGLAPCDLPRFHADRQHLHHMLLGLGLSHGKASAILTYRQEHGPFTNLEGLMDVPGIGPGIFASIREYISLED